MSMTKNYHKFLEQKTKHIEMHGFKPIWMPDFLFDFQQHLVDWSIRKGRAAIFADCGLGKTAMELVWSANVNRKTNKPVLLVCPLAVTSQMEEEGEKFGIAVTRSKDGKPNGDITVTNYERLHYFSPSDYAGIVCDESSILKNFKGATREAITEFNKCIPYRLLCTATAAPNDHWELGTSSEALGYLGHVDMMTRFFRQDTSNPNAAGWGNRQKYRLRGWSEQPFWRWVCSWARACRKPSDIGFNDDKYQLPPLLEHEVVVENSTPRDGFLFPINAQGLAEQREERRITIDERCNECAELVAAHDEPSVSWCHLNDEGNLLEKLIPDAKQVKGCMSDDEKEEILHAFQHQQIKRIIIKPKIGCFGLNWQHCALITTFPSHSWEQYYQSVRRCWRFGQSRTVNIHIITTEGEKNVVKNLQRKAEQADKMFDSLVRNMNQEMNIQTSKYGNKKEELPSWL